MVRVAVIGAGSTGLTATKTCLEYGYDVVCYEKTHDLGGLWRYKPHECDGEASVMRSTIIDTSKEMCAYSDFPPPADYANFMHNRQMLAYFRSYAEKFNVLPRIKYNCEVQLVKRAEDYANTGHWLITVKDIKSSNVTTQTFDGVLLATGHHAHPHEPDFQGIKDGTFKGRVLHSHSYKEDSSFIDQNVIVVGIGNSGVDVAVELSRAAKQVYLVTRRGSWILNRVYDKGVPWDMFANSHYFNFFIKVAPRAVQAMLERKLQKRVDLETYGLMPAHHLFQQHPTICDGLPDRILSGTIQVKPNIKKFTGPKECLFEDGTSVKDVDAVVLCTGYSFGFPYLEKGVIPVQENKVELYKYMYAPNIDHPETLAVLGCIQPGGAIFPVAEMQARVFCEYLKPRPGRVLPSKELMYEDIREKVREMKEIFVESRRHTIQVPFIPFQYELANMIDATPPSPISCLLKGDPKLAWSLAFGPCMSYEFRLRGPHPWNGARDAVVNVWDRVHAATKTRTTPTHVCGANRSYGFDCLIKHYSGTIIIGIVSFVILLLALVYVF